MPDVSNADMLRGVSDVQLDSWLDMVMAAGGCDPGEFSELKAEIERRKVEAFNNHRDRERFELIASDRARRSRLYVDVAKASVEATMLQAAKQDLDRKQVLISKLMDVRRRVANAAA